jgi:hypothetical protein
VDQTVLAAILTETAERGPSCKTPPNCPKNHRASLGYQDSRGIPAVARANVSIRKGVQYAEHPTAVFRDLPQYDRCEANWLTRPAACRRLIH